MEIEGASTILLNSCFSFFICFVYTAPLALLFSLVFYFLFLKLHEFKISLHLRKFFFIKATLLQTLLEGNVSYFVFVQESHQKFWKRRHILLLASLLFSLITATFHCISCCGRIKHQDTTRFQNFPLQNILLSLADLSFSLYSS